MYDSPRRRSGSNRVVGARARRIPTEAHEGSHWDFLRRHEREASEVAGGTAQAKREFSRCLLRRIADTRNLFCAIEYVARDPDKAPGPNGVRADRLENFERWNLARTLREVVWDRERECSHYRPGPVRTVQIRKTDGGSRPIEIQNIEDRVVHRATAQILGPFLDPLFAPHSVGFRPGLGREVALALATNLIRPGNSMVISEDIRNAFGSVPRNRLIDCLGATGITDDVCDLVARAMSRATGRGIPQGSALSPLMLNVYLNHFLDGPWLDRHPERPILRYADNLLLTASDEQEAARLYNELHGLLLPTGMLLKYGRDNSSIRNLETGQAVGWLGYRMTRWNRLEIGIGPDSWTRLEDHLAECHVHPDATLRASEVVTGTLDQLGPAYGSENIENVVARVQEIAAAQGFEELPTGEVLEQTWRGAYVRFRAVKRVITASTTTVAGGSAHQHRDLADNSRGLGGPAPAGFPGPTFSFPEVHLISDGSCLGSNGPGGFAYVLVRPDGRREFRSGGVLRSTNNRMELTAVIRGLEAIEQPSRVTLESDSRYVIDGLTQHLVGWRMQRWRRRGGQLANADLWRRLDELLDRHQVRCRWVRGHSGHVENELCDRAAREAALQMIGARSSSNRSN
jgi:ribonuclease HI/retron-type reverse transcriptase